MNDTKMPPEFYTILDESLVQVLSGQQSIAECVANHPQYADTLETELSLALMTSRLQSPQLSNEKVDSLDTKLRQKMAMMNQQTLHISQPKSTQSSPKKIIPFNPRPFLSRTAAILLLVFIVALGSGGGVVIASSDTVPGDTLYPVKRLWETIVLVIASVTGQLDDAWLDITEARLNEAEKLAKQGELDQDAMQDLYTAFEHAIENSSTNNDRLINVASRITVAFQQETLWQNADTVVNQQIVNMSVMVHRNYAESQSDEGLSSDNTQSENRVESTSELVMTETPSPAVTANILDTENTLATMTLLPTQTFTTTATSTSRIPATPTRTSTPTVTSTFTPTTTFTPTVTATDFPTSTPLPIVPTASEGSLPTTTPRAGQSNMSATPLPTWYPYTQLTLDVFYLTRTAEWQNP